MLMLSRVELHIYNEQDFWDMTPTKFYALLNEAMDWHKSKWGMGEEEAQPNQKEEVVSIDNIPGW